jgi:hypothetical protein
MEGMCSGGNMGGISTPGSCNPGPPSHPIVIDPNKKKIVKHGIPSFKINK